MVKSFTSIAPWITGTACLLYLYSWSQGIEYPAYVPLAWCLAVFVNDVYNWLEQRRGN